MQKMKKILFLHHATARGGSFLSLIYLINSLDRTQFDLQVCNCGDEQDPKVLTILNENKITTYSCKLPRFTHTTGGSYKLTNILSLYSLYRWISYYPTAKNNLSRLLNDVKPDIVHFNSITMAPYARIAKMNGIQTIIHVRESILPGIFGIRKHLILNQLNFFCDAIISICKDNLDTLEISQEKTAIIYNPVDFNKFDFRIDGQKVRQELGIPLSSNVVLFAGGSVWEEKGLFDFIKAMDIVTKHEKDVVILMPGFQFPTDPLKRSKSLKQMIISKLGAYKDNDYIYQLLKSGQIVNHIFNREFVYNIEQWFAMADVICVPHIKPHFSRAVMEAGAMKKPVVAYKIGGVQEVVLHEKTGLLVDLGDYYGLAQAIQFLIRNKKEAAKLGEGGFEQAKKLFDVRQSANHIMKIYSNLVK